MNAATSRQTDRRYYGIAEGIVVENEDPEGEGRVRVKLPWFSEAEITDWCRVTQLYAGPGYGSLFVPEIDDEVFVMFVHGDPRLPVVVGGAYNGVDKPPSARTATVDQKLVRTKAGHQLLLDDSGDARSVSIETAGGHALTLDDTGSKIVVQTSGGNRVELDDGAGTITISAGMRLVLEAPQIEINGSTSVAISGGQVRLN